MKSNEIREKFLAYFEKLGHQRVKSSSLIPAADPTLLFTNAGMVQFKDVFLGLSKPGYLKATTAQKCVRAGGKHNDLENVGFTPRHHTFFEMLGNFSFGDYFKKEAIHLAWNFLTKELGISPERLRVTVYHEDSEALDLWKELGVRPDYIEKLGEKDNFWAMGDTGPCGPCTEIHYDWGEKYSSAPSPGKDTEGKRFLEIWNLVFMQFNRDASGTLTPLPKPSVDTGAGLERLSAVMQGVYSNYDTDLFLPIIHQISEKAGVQYGKSKDTDIALRVMADHLRSTTFLIADGVIPSNEGRGYVLRRILRRAVRYGKKVGKEDPFLYQCVGSVSELLGSVYPELNENKDLITTLIREEESRFHETLHRGLGVLEDAIKKLKEKKSEQIPGETAFLLYDSYGFPLDLIEVIAREQGFAVDEAGFTSRMERQRSQSGVDKTQNKEIQEAIFKTIESQRLQTQFEGYEKLDLESVCLALWNDQGKEVKCLETGTSGFAVFSKTPFYAESGGQIGDVGTITSKESSARVETTQKIAKQTVVSLVVENGRVEVNRPFWLKVDPELRRFTMRNHTATHLLHAALRLELGDRVRQAGSLVDSERLRFDFTFPHGLTEAQLKTVESRVNLEIEKGLEVQISEMAYDEAQKKGALAFFDEKYGERVRVVQVGSDRFQFSTELCGGTHVSNLAEIGIFKILAESSVASGVRRIEAVTSEKAKSFLFQREEFFSKVESVLGVKGEGVGSKIESLFLQVKTLQKENEQLKIKALQAGQSGQKNKKEPLEIQGKKVFIEEVSETDPKVLRAIVDRLRDQGKTQTIVALFGNKEGKVSLCVGLTSDLTEKFQAGKLVQLMAPAIEGKGGGRPDFAQAGGNKTEGIAKAIGILKNYLDPSLGS